MVMKNASFEVEIRCHFDSPEEAYKVLPFVRSCLRREISWVTRYYGLTLFKSGQLLRVSEVVYHGEVRHYLGWKGPDIGGFANIRQEVDEEITAGLVNSAIMRRLGAKGEIGTADAVGGELERLGHHQFMSFGGSDLTGYEEPLGLNVKLMTCPVLRWPLLVELEKTANTEEEATQCELELHELSTKFQLQSRLVREEPPSLLYAGLFAHQDGAD